MTPEQETLVIDALREHAAYLRRWNSKSEKAKLMLDVADELESPTDDTPRLGVKLLRPDAKMPVRATPGSAGLDVFACMDEPMRIPFGATAKVPLGIALDIPDGWHVDARGRSGNELRGYFSVRLGLIDSDYRGELCAIVHSLAPEWGAREGWIVKHHTINPGDKIAQLVLRKTEMLPILEVQELSETARADKGFGSSGSR